MIGSSMAPARDGHMRLSTVVDRFPASVRWMLRAFAILIPLIFLLIVAHLALEYARDERAITTPALGISNFWRAVAMFSGFRPHDSDCCLAVALTMQAPGRRRGVIGALRLHRPHLLNTIKDCFDW
ncbi:TRAP transporter small permease subunit [Bradyrhizobium sp. 190]|uniref:TRAP transporter small permease subunit n=1 Tax=Bradyrhizobium sp. 190 TaxID=2782658 RepID=UPI0035AC1085